ncbi:hypothetical protein [Treponema phagedenis]|uniref:hypothetical protein n=1 Tax=Treponema phagedenis TaxID=162 RepID=UPI0011ED3CA0|nr:hypothetical protein [Treponema phagedenis]TYT78578.1 hypothetical protein FS559_05300 [Treponema phagedenis]
MDGGGSTQQDVLKQNKLQSFKTRRLVFATGGKNQNKFKRCLKASTVNYKIEAFKLAALI